MQICHLSNWVYMGIFQIYENLTMHNSLKYERNRVKIFLQIYIFRNMKKLILNGNLCQL